MTDPAPLRVLVNLTWLVPGVVGGSEESTTDALRAVLETHPEVEPTLAVLAPFASAHPDLAAACRCEVLDSRGANKAARVLAEQTWLAGRTRALSPDVVHHAGGVIPLVHPGRSVLTVHDLQPLDLPANFGAVKRAYLHTMLGRSARAAEVVCVPSHFTRSRVVERLGVDPDRVVVVPWSVSAPADVDADEPAGGGSPSGNGGDAGDGPLFLYPAITYPHKNHATLLEAFAAARQRLPGARLVLAGGQGPVEDEVMRRVRAAGLGDAVLRPGRVGRAEMESLYRRATAVVVPSRYEGFGLPALEAMTRGVPLVVSSAGSLPEVVALDDAPGVGGVAAVCEPLDPDDVAGWAGAMVAAAGLDEAARAQLAAHERSAAARFTPRRTADSLVGAYLRAARRDHLP